MWSCKLLCVTMENPTHTLAYNPCLQAMVWSVIALFQKLLAQHSACAFRSFFWRSTKLHNFNWLLKSCQTSKDIVFLPKGRQEPVRESIWHFFESCFWSSVQVKVPNNNIKRKTSDFTSDKTFFFKSPCYFYRPLYCLFLVFSNVVFCIENKAVVKVH